MDAIDSLRSVLSDPDLAYILLMFSVLGISVEILTPGLIFPSTIGIITGIFAFISLSALPVNLIGLALIMVALAFFIAEALAKTKGLITALGLISMFIGSLFLFKGGAENRVNPYLIAGTTVVVSAILIFVANKVASAQRKRVITGREDVKGRTAVARTSLDPAGMVFFEGERWNAVLNEGKAEPCEELIINRLEGLTLYVSKKGGKQA